MEEQTQSNVIDVSGFSESDAFAISRLKETINDVLPTAFPNDTPPALDVTSNPYDENFLSVVQQYLLNDTTSDNPDLQVLKDQYMSVSDEGRAHIESYSNYVISGDNAPNENEKQAQKIIQRAQQYLGALKPGAEPNYSPEGDDYYANVDGVTVYAAGQYLERMKQENPELVDEPFDSNTIDDKSLGFMNRLVAKRMDEANVKPGDLNSTLVHLWAINDSLSNSATAENTAEERLSSAASIRNLIGLISEGNLPNGNNARVHVNNAFTGPVYEAEMTEDRFFSKETYTSIMNDREVPASTLFAEDSGNPHVEDLKLAAKSLGIDTDSGVVSQEQIGQIAMRMLEYHACKLGIEKHEITAAINNHELMPDLDDLRLVEFGLGLPPEVVNKDMDAHDLYEAEFLNRSVVVEYRNERWEQEFGKMDDDEVTRRINIFYNGDANDASLREHVRDNYTLPTLNYGSPRSIVGSTEPTYYEVHRGGYLDENLDKLLPCVSESTDVNLVTGKEPEADTSDNQNSFSSAAAAPQSSQDELNAGIQDATGSEAGAIPEEQAETAPKPEQSAQISATQ
jgi:uncharacterized protein (UPF0297 family)